MGLKLTALESEVERVNVNSNPANLHNDQLKAQLLNMESKMKTTSVSPGDMLEGLKDLQINMTDLKDWKAKASKRLTLVEQLQSKQGKMIPKTVEQIIKQNEDGTFR